MKKKSFFLSLTLVCTFVVSSIANPILKPIKALEIKIKSELEKIDLDYKELNGQTVKIRFMLNEKKEILVLSTDQESLDDKVKAVLNYDKVSDVNLSPFKVYVVPVTFQSE